MWLYARAHCAKERARCSLHPLEQAREERRRPRVGRQRRLRTRHVLDPHRLADGPERDEFGILVALLAGTRFHRKRASSSCSHIRWAAVHLVDAVGRGGSEALVAQVELELLAVGDERRDVGAGGGERVISASAEGERAAIFFAIADAHPIVRRLERLGLRHVQPRTNTSPARLKA